MKENNGALFAISIARDTERHRSVFFVAPHATVEICTGLSAAAVPRDAFGIVQVEPSLSLVLQTAFVTHDPCRGIHLHFINTTDLPQRMPLGRCVASIAFVPSLGPASINARASPEPRGSEAC